MKIKRKILEQDWGLTDTFTLYMKPCLIFCFPFLIFLLYNKHCALPPVPFIECSRLAELPHVGLFDSPRSRCEHALFFIHWICRPEEFGAALQHKSIEFKPFVIRVCLCLTNAHQEDLMKTKTETNKHAQLIPLFSKIESTVKSETLRTDYSALCKGLLQGIPHMTLKFTSSYLQT